MEIHAPHEPVQSLRQMLTHLALVTMGVLIALSFEGIGTWREHRALVREARANILSELSDNHNELENRLKGIVVEQKNIDETIAVAQRLLETKQLKGSVQLGFETADLRDASRRTAEITGAFALMEYDEVKKYAELYSHQELFMRTQADAMRDLARTMGVLNLLKYADRASVRELEQWQMDLRAVLGDLTVEEGLGKKLLKDYEHVLEGKEP